MLAYALALNLGTLSLSSNADKAATTVTFEPFEIAYTHLSVVGVTTSQAVFTLILGDNLISKTFSIGVDNISCLECKRAVHMCMICNICIQTLYPHSLNNAF